MPRIIAGRPQETGATQVRERPKTVRPPAHETREAREAVIHTVHPESAPMEWTDPTNLEAPQPRPGFIQRWVRDLTTPDSRDNNFAKKYREGWRPRDPATVGANFFFMKGNSSAGEAVLRIGNNVLCEMPVQMANQRAAHYRSKLENQMRSAGVTEMADAAAAGRRAGMKPIETLVEDIVPGRRAAPTLLD